MTKVAINGFGRIGRTFFKMAVGHPDFEIVAINDLGQLENLAYLLRYDTAYGRSGLDVAVNGDTLVVNGQTIAFSQERNPESLPWGTLGIDVVVEATGVFASYEKAKAHLTAGAKRVVVSAPVKDEAEAAGVTGTTVLMGVNDEALQTSQISSNASCTTNATSPLVAILKEHIGIEKAILNTVHAYTSTQQIIDGPSKDFRKGRAAAQNIIPTSTGAAVATTKAHTDLAGKFDGIAMRVPVPVGSIVDVTFVASKDTTVEEVNEALKTAANSPQWQKLFAATDEPLVSSDIIGARYAAIADLSMTRVVDGNLVKVLAWYDNETSYTHTLTEHVAAIAKFFNAKQGE
ncbi:type I glyceraldehyde-3-phosphate dehydrogenase [bacterium]|nr:type I glyceraldehyde-3-phosphate dehydrogenase [bacterium]|tara:strand:+ start:7321 stop:8358 length:1038 start_codon:yes stop_codon:yes gene_type:complete